MTGPREQLPPGPRREPDPVTSAGLLRQIPPKHRPIDPPNGLPRRDPDTRPGRLTLAVGPAGAGKSTWFMARYGATETVSRDVLRETVAGDPNDQSQPVNDACTHLIRVILSNRLSRGLRVALDITGAELDRCTWAGYALRYDAWAELVVFDVPWPLVRYRQTVRPGPAPGRTWGRRVPDAAARTQYDETQDVLTTVHRLRAGMHPARVPCPDIAAWHAATVVTVNGDTIPPHVDRLLLPAGVGRPDAPKGLLRPGRGDRA